MLPRAPLDPDHLHPAPPRMPRLHHRDDFEPLQPEIRRDKIAPLLVHPSAPSLPGRKEKGTDEPERLRRQLRRCAPRKVERSLIFPDRSKLNEVFLWNVVNDERFWQRYATAQPFIRPSEIRRSWIPLPPPDEQTAIARILDAVDTALERTRAAVERARELERSVLEDTFESLHAQHVQLREFTADVRYGTSKASSERAWGNPVLRIPNVVADRLSLGDLALVDLPTGDVERLSLHDGDLLLVRTNGNPHYVGRSVVFRRPDARTWVYASYLIRVRLKAGLLPDFVNVFLGLERGRRELLRRVTTSAGNHNINSNSIRLLRLPVPASQDEQAHLVEIASACRTHVDALRAKAAALEVLKKSLMHDLLTGRVRVTNPAKVAAS
ncbi:MAG: restriction endonuclease subunit S [Candidatus Eisenbacteria bacterium]|nr:restriction endonuclease subunit S [Candidatus Eisenbacteria bacterium]